MLLGVWVCVSGLRNEISVVIEQVAQGGEFEKINGFCDASLEFLIPGTGRGSLEMRNGRRIGVLFQCDDRSDPDFLGRMIEEAEDTFEGGGIVLHSQFMEFEKDFFDVRAGDNVVGRRWGGRLFG